MGALAVVSTFLASSIGRYAIIAMLAGGLLIGIRQSGVNAERRRCEAAAVHRTAEIRQRDKTIGELQARLDKQISHELKTGKDFDDAVQRKLEEEIAKRPVADQCRATPADIERLR